MFHKFLFALLFVSVQAQINGDFWWLNSKLNNLKNMSPSPPKIEVSDFQNDDSSKIIFRDDDLFTNKLKPIADRTSKLAIYENPGSQSKIVWPTNTITKNRNDKAQNGIKENVEAMNVVWPSNEHMKNHDVDVSDYLTNVKKEKEDLKIIWNSNEHMKNHDVDVTKLTNNETKNKNEIKQGSQSNEHMKNHDIEVIKTTSSVIKSKPIQNKLEDILVFSYPKNEDYITASKSSTEATFSTSLRTATNEIGNESTEIVFNAETLTTIKDKESQNICTYITKKNCLQLDGFVYEYSRRIPKTSGDEPLVCCILPLKPLKVKREKLSDTNSYFPTTVSNSKRFKRSEIEESIALNQRDFLLKQKFTNQRQNAKPLSTPLTKIVTPPHDDYVDPYWNVKNTKFQNAESTKLENTKYDYYSDDSVEEYTDELPKPGLIGLYSDHAMSPSSWTFSGGNKGFTYGGTDDDYEDEDDEDDTFGYSTIDPRQGTKKTKEKPQKLTTTSDETTYDAESHTINFHSNPDFHVFQGFKLLNLFRNTSRVHTKNTKKKSGHDHSDEVLIDTPEEIGEIGEFHGDKQLFNGCGKVAKKVNERGSHIGESANGSHPWMALVVLTKRRHNVLCYAALVHPRAAVTVADCVQGTAPGDITVIAGLWDLADRSRSRNRVATVQVHPRYTPGNVDNNLAILHWMRPLKLSVSIQPACLGEPELGEECKFFGWGGLDQGIQQQRSRWQRVTIRACTGRPGSKHSRPSGDAFCVSSPRGTVTGMGGPLVCEVEGHSTIVGTVVSRHSGYVLLPVRDWTMKSEHLISGD